VYNNYTRLHARYDGRDKCFDTTIGKVLGSSVVSTMVCPGGGRASQQLVLAVAEAL
jgi:hypothetical protein